MPGVPSGRACEGCRKQKKKCDEIQPSCSRCTRLDIVCVGSGQQRYKFKEETGFQQKQPRKGRSPRPKSGSGSPKEWTVVAVPAVPSYNGAALLARTFIETIRGTTDLRYNLGWAYGFYLYDIPQRLGTNEALDSSADALVAAHSSFCADGLVSLEAFKKYSQALNVLRTYLDDPMKARASDTLGAVALLLICQSFLGNPDLRWTGHAEGAAQILKARRYSTPQDDFEAKILLSLRGPVLFEGLFNHKIDLNAEEWKALIESELDKTTPEGQLMRSLARVPDIMRRGKHTSEGDNEHTELRDEMRTFYEKSKEVVDVLQKRWASVEQPDSSSPILAVRLHAHFQRMYGLGLVIGLILNRVLSAFDTKDNNLIVESTHYATEILALAPQATRYRPIGANYMTMCLVAAWVGTEDKELKSEIEIALKDYQKDFSRRTPTRNLIGDLEYMTDQMRLLSPASPPSAPPESSDTVA